jgi:uroporphyrinogen III methyltransferase/synthase
VYRSGKCKKVGVTATDMLWDKLETGFEGLGIVPVPVCKMQVCETEGITVLDEILRSEKKSKNRLVQAGDLDRQEKTGLLDDYNWLVFTSQNAVKLFFDRLHKLKLDMRKISHMNFAVLGSGTAAKLSEYGYYADFVPTKYNVSDFAMEFSEYIKNQAVAPRILIPRALQGSTELTRIFDENGLEFTALPIYDVKGVAAKQMDNIFEMDYLVFVSASGVTAFFEELDRRKLELPETIKFACIGNVTAKRLSEEYERRKSNARPPVIIANVNDVDGLINAVKNEILK